MKTSEVILECADTSNCTDANTGKLNDSFNIMKSKDKCKVPPTDEFGGENKDSSFCNDLCNQLDSLGIRDIENDSKCDEKLQKKLPGENELILGQLERLSLSGDISTHLDENTTPFLSIVDDEYHSGLEHDQNEKPDTLENTDYVIRGQPQEHEDVDESQERILVSRGPVGGVPVNQPEIYNFYGSRRPTIEVNQPVISGTYEWSRQQVDYDYERQSHEPPSKFVKPAADFSVNQTPFCGPFFGSNDVGLPQLPQGNWLVQCDTRPDLHLFTSHRNLSGGCVAVQSGQSPPTMGGFPVVSVSSHVLNQQVDNQVVIDELFQQNSPTSAELELTPDVWEEASEFFDGIFCEKTLFGEESQTSDGCCDIESTAGSASDAGYYSPSYNISSPGSAGEISTVCQSPDNLSNNSVDSDDDLALVLDICQNDLLKTPSTITSPPHVIESYKAQLMAEGNVSDGKFSFAGPRFDCSFIPIGNCQNSHVQEQPGTSEHLASTVKGPNQRILPKCTSSPSVYVTNHPQQQRSPVPDLPLPVGQIPLKTTTGDTAVAAERKYKEIRPKPVMQPLEQSSAQLNCTPGMITAAFYVPPPLASTSRRSEAIDDQKIAKYCRLIATLDNDKLRHRDQERDTVLHVAIVRDEYLLVRALLPRLEREKLISEIINARNMQNQTPLYMAVCLNQPDTVGLLLEFGADVNVQIRRQTDTGPRFFLPIHFAASQGLEWSDALEELLKCPAIDVHALNDQGRTALHCAIDAHQKTKDNSTCKIDSLRIIYLLALYRADLGKEDGLSGKTPLHYVIEKKNLDLLAWFLGLIRHEFVGNAQHSRPAHEIINARTNSNATALTIAWSLPIHLVERVRMIKLLLASGAELSAKHDVSLRRELLKIPELSEALRANCRTNCRT